jgi:gliding motility-associated-like protein
MKPLSSHIIFILFFLIIFNELNAQEICNNGKDDDGNGLTDLYDAACQCHFTVNGNLLQNGSFESYDHCPLSYTYTNDYKIANYWQYGTYTNIAEAYYYHNLKCTYDSSQVMFQMPPQMPLPDGTGFMSIQNNTYIHPIPEQQIPKTYFGQCLQRPLTKGESYTLSFYAGRFISWDNFKGNLFPYKVAIFGNKDCNAVPFGKVNASGNGCPANYAGWIFLGEITISTYGSWVQSKITFIAPDNINVIEVGPDCSVLTPINDLTDSTTFLDYHLYYLDDMHLLPTEDFNFRYIQARTTGNCSAFPILQAPVYANGSYQWYKDSIAVVGATSSIYNVTDTTGITYYNVRIITSDTCVITEPYLVTASKLNQIRIPEDTAMCASDTLLLAPEIIGITYTVNGTISTSVKITAPGNYSVIASDIQGCTKTFNTNITLQNCADCTINVPSAFTPNGDGLNDVFKAQLNCFAASFHCMIFNRWGKKVFETSNIHDGWNGYSNGNIILVGTYVYYVEYKTNAGIIKTAKGVVVLMQ